MSLVIFLQNPEERIGQNIGPKKRYKLNPAEKATYFFATMFVFFCLYTGILVKRESKQNISELRNLSNVQNAQKNTDSSSNPIHNDQKSINGAYDGNTPNNQGTLIDDGINKNRNTINNEQKTIKLNNPTETENSKNLRNQNNISYKLPNSKSIRTNPVKRNNLAKSTRNVSLKPLGPNKKYNSNITRKSNINKKA
ncbi:hypothetical protein [Candidatus Nesciobacter abundans]|uniref:Uncharacterized protein n=1 Tax=Candidatus Nesciobacter abundans TaxID=2601668 RepID=A0A5C0UJ73_9PROT|nr:hypothetical protein [Candidatus Nesciobacter abundans]QEK38854.1 hypothetical protein FZC36_00140 [Candidatus Nesciobacter abundans]